MVDKKSTETVMKFVLDKEPVLAECQLAVAQGDVLMEGFKSANDQSTSFANFFEVTGFDLDLALKEGDTKNLTLDSGIFARWRSAKENETILYPLEFDKFTFERIIDRASPIFFQCCCTSKSFDSATLVKRVSQGDINARAVGFLRIDFTSVLITGVDWTDGEVVTEKVEFICKGLAIAYHPQSAAGKISSKTAAGGKAIWPNPNDSRPRV